MSAETPHPQEGEQNQPAHPVPDERQDIWNQIYGEVGKPVEEGGVLLSEIARTMDEHYANVDYAYHTGADRLRLRTLREQLDRLTGKRQAISGEPIPAPIYEADFARRQRNRRDAYRKNPEHYRAMSRQTSRVWLEKPENRERDRRNHRKIPSPDSDMTIASV